MQPINIDGPRPLIPLYQDSHDQLAGMLSASFARGSQEVGVPFQFGVDPDIYRALAATQREAGRRVRVEYIGKTIVHGLFEDQYGLVVTR
jgi:hypothetical protein